MGVLDGKESSHLKGFIALMYIFIVNNVYVMPSLVHDEIYLKVWIGFNFSIYCFSKE